MQLFLLILVLINSCKVILFLNQAPLLKMGLFINERIPPAGNNHKHTLFSGAVASGRAESE